MDESHQLSGPMSASQALLFSDFGEQPHLVEKTKVFIHTGKITGKDEELCAAIIEAYATGMISKRSIARRLGVGRETVKAIIRLAEESGKLGPLKERLSKKMGQTIEVCLDTLHEMAEEGKIPANVLPIVIGVLSDKKADAEGAANLRVEIVGRREVTAEDVMAEFEAMKKATVIDVQSGVSPSIDTLSGQTGGQS